MSDRIEGRMRPLDDGETAVLLPWGSLLALGLAVVAVALTAVLLPW